MEELSGNNEKLNFIRILQNPSKQVSGNCKDILDDFGVDYLNELQWIKFENKFSVECFSGLEGSVLEQVILILSVFNTQGGIASEYMNRIELMPRNEVLRLYYKYMPIREVSYVADVFSIVSSWLYDNNYISELELNRMLHYKLNNELNLSDLGDFNRIIIQEEMKKYVKESWKQIM